MLFATQTAPDTVTPRGLDAGAIRLYVTDQAGALELGPALPIAGVSESSWESEIETDESYGEAQYLDLFSRWKGCAGSVKAVQVALHTCAALVGTEVIESANPGDFLEWSFDEEDDNSPFFQLTIMTKYLGNNKRGVAEKIFERCKIQKLGIVFQRGYAEVEFDWMGFARNFSDENGKKRMFGFRIRGGEGLELEDARFFCPFRQMLPLWDPDASSNWSGRTNSADVIQQRLYKAIGVGEYQEFIRPMGAGAHRLQVFAQKGPDAGKYRVLVDGDEVDEKDLYAAGVENDAEQITTFALEEAGFHTIRIETVESNPLAGADIVELASAELVGLYSEAQHITNRLPAPVGPVRVFASEYTRSSSVPEVVDVGREAAEKVEIDGLGEFLEYDVAVDPGTYRIDGWFGKGADSGIVTVKVDGEALGAENLQSGSTLAPEKLALAGGATFTRHFKSMVTVRFSVLAKHTSSTGFKAMLAYFKFVKTADVLRLSSGEHGTERREYLPWHADVKTGWTGAASTTIRNWIHTSDGSAGRVLTWADVLTKGTYRARLHGEIEAGGPDLELRWNGSKVGDLSLNGTPLEDGRVEAEVVIPATVRADLSLLVPAADVAKVVKLELERVN